LISRREILFRELKRKNWCGRHLEAQVPGGCGPGQPEHLPHGVHIWQIYGALPQQDMTQTKRKLKVREKLFSLEDF
jgi:hypothetical protein